MDITDTPPTYNNSTSPNDTLPPYHNPSTSSSIPSAPHPTQQFQTLRLRQSSQTSQTLTADQELTLQLPRYSTQSFDNSGLLRRKRGDLVITRETAGGTKKTCDVKFGQGLASMILTSPDGESKEMTLVDSKTQAFKVVIGGEGRGGCVWAPSLTDTSSIVLTTEKGGEVLAKFRYLGRDHSDQNRQTVVGISVGELEVLGGLVAEMEVFERIVCSALAVLERGRRRGKNSTG